MTNTFHFSRARGLCAIASALAAVGVSLTAAHAAPPPSMRVGTIVFHSNRDGTTHQIYRMNVGGSAQTRITNNADYDYFPALSPNGKKIAFVSNRDGNHEIYTMNVDGSAQTRVTTNTAHDTSPAWSPDGTKIAFTRTQPNGSADVFTMHANGTGQTNRTNNLANEDSPAWSPDGTKIAFGRGTGGVSDLYTMNVDGSAQTLLASNGGDPAWSPDGTKIAFTASTDSDLNIYTIRSNGSGRTNLTNYVAPPGSDVDGAIGPSWSPDGTQIAFASDRDSGDEDVDDIFTMNADGSEQTRLTTNPGPDASPSWGSRFVTGKPGPRLPPK